MPEGEFLMYVDGMNEEFAPPGEAEVPSGSNGGRKTVYENDLSALGVNVQTMN